MRIDLLPYLTDEAMEAECFAPDCLRINGQEFDFSELPDGATIPLGRVPCAWIGGDVSRVGGELRIPLVFPFQRPPSSAVAFPEPIIVTELGPIEYPVDPPPPDPQPEFIPEEVNDDVET